MRTRLLKSIVALAAIMSALVFLKPAQVTVAQEGPTASATAQKAAAPVKTGKCLVMQKRQSRLRNFAISSTLIALSAESPHLTRYRLLHLQFKF